MTLHAVVAALMAGSFMMGAGAIAPGASKQARLALLLVGFVVCCFAGGSLLYGAATPDPRDKSPRLIRT